MTLMFVWWFSPHKCWVLVLVLIMLIFHKYSCWCCFWCWCLVAKSHPLLMTPSPRASNAAPMSAVTVTAQRKFPKSETYLEISHVNTKTCILADHPPHRRRSSAAKQGASRSSYPTFSSPWSFVWAWTSAGASGARWPTMGEGQRWATPRLDRQPNLSHHQDFSGQRSWPVYIGVEINDSV